MIWNSIAAMTLIDCLIVIIGVLVGVIFVRHFAEAKRLGLQNALRLVIVGLSLIAGFYFADLAIMFLVPMMGSRANAYRMMTYLHLNWSWIVVSLGVGLMGVGLVDLLRVLIPRASRASATLEDEIRRQTDALKLSETKFNKAFLSSPHPVLISRLQDGLIFEVNRALLDYTGYAREELVGHSAPEIGLWRHVEDRHRFAHILRTTGRVRDFEFDYVKKSGEIGVAVVSAEIISINGEKHILSVIDEITKRKVAERALQDSEKIYREAIESADGVPYRLIYRPEGPRYDFVGKGIERLMGVAAEEFTQDFFIQAIVETTITQPGLPSDPETCHRAFLRGEVARYRADHKLQRPDGTTIWLSDSSVPIRDSNTGEVIGSLGIIQDITDRKLVEEALRVHARRLRGLREIDRAILEEQSAEAIARAAMPKVLEQVPAWQASVYHFEAGQNVETRLAHFIDGHFIPAASLMSLDDLFAGLAKDRYRLIRLESGRQPAGLSRAQCRAFQETGIGAVLIAPLMVGAAQVGAIGLAFKCGVPVLESSEEMLRDIAGPLAIALHHSHLRQEIQRHTEELEQLVADRTRELSVANKDLQAFAYMISHDLRAPLRGMQGFAQALIEESAASLGPTGMEYVHRIAQAAAQMDALIQDLLAYSQLSQAGLDLQACDLGAIVAEVLGGVREKIRTSGAIIDVQDGMPPVLATRPLLKQIVQNLLENALKFVAPGVAPRVRVYAQETGARVRLWVVDNGIGIAPADHQRIFKVFERLHGMDNYQGTGIGLAIVKKGVDRLNGRCGVESAPGEGSKFWVELTTASETAKQQVASEIGRLST